MSFSWLPARLAEIAEIVGPERALKIAELRGGARLMFPRRVKPDHWLADAIGLEHAQALCDHFSSTGGVPIDIPLGPKGSHAEIRRAVDRMIAEGVSSEEIARTLRVSARNVRRRKNRAPAGDPRQSSLF